MATALGPAKVSGLTKGLGWFSLGLGVAELTMPGKMAGLIGVPDRAKTKAVLRSYGLREIASGIGILAQPRQARWLWSRVAGDAMDLSWLGAALASSRANKTRVACAAAAVAGVTALDLLCGKRLRRSNGGVSQAIGPMSGARVVP